MDYIIKRASALTTEEQTLRGILGIPQAWIIEKYLYTDTIPAGFELLSDADITLSQSNNQAAYDAWLQALRPIAAPPALQSVNINLQPSFSSKVLLSGKKLFRRGHGVSFTLNDSATNSGITVVDFTIPYAQCKITEAKILWAPEGIFANFEVYDTAAGTYSTVPNYKLNQFGFNVGIAKDFFSDKSDYDADLYAGMIIRVTFTNTTNISKLMCIDLVLHEVK